MLLLVFDVGNDGVDGDGGIAVELLDDIGVHVVDEKCDVQVAHLREFITFLYQVLHALGLQIASSLCVKDMLTSCKFSRLHIVMLLK